MSKPIPEHLQQSPLGSCQVPDLQIGHQNTQY